MATLKYSGLILDIRGKLNGSQLSKNRSGALLQRKGSQRRFATGAQILQRSKFSTLARYWRTLSPAEQQENSDNAANYPYIDKYGDTRYYTGYQLLLRSNLNRIAIGLPPINIVPATPPAGVVIGDGEALAYYGGIPYSRQFFVDWGILSGSGSGYTAVLFLSPAVSAGNTAYTGKYAQVGYTMVTNQDIQINGNAVYYHATWMPGLRVFFYISVVHEASGIEVSAYTGFADIEDVTP